ncbi:hypothetical protein [Anaerovibrio sp. RM50]|uniref:hypothetical protein n=1 Tax=Anaerovibrio sp. RM50 TaxID=1200557 RepID=UPI000484B1E1|nr:hypothetical protein [Anaerovibrio sp. RM50]
MDAERWMQLHPEIDMIAAINKIKDYFKDNLYQIILFPPTDRYPFLEILLDEHDHDNFYSDLSDELLFDMDLGTLYREKDDFNALLPFGEQSNYIAREGIVFYGPELKRPNYDLKKMPVDANYAERHDINYRFNMAFNVGYVLAQSIEAFAFKPVELIERWLTSQTAYDVYQLGHSYDEKYHYPMKSDVIFDDFAKELSLNWVGPQIVNAIVDKSPMFWLGYMLQHLMYKDGLPPATLLKKYNIRRIIADIEILWTLCANDAVDILSEKYTLNN